jgi:TonB family protein
MRAIAPPATTSDTGRMRATAPPMQPIAPMPVAPAARALPAWTPEPLGMGEDEFAQLSAQAKLGVQQTVVDEAAKRKRQRLFMACGAAVVVAAAIVFVIENYDPEARAREAAIAQTVQKMAEQQKVTDNLTLIEIDIENAIMNNDLDTARRELAKLVEQRPDHPRREFLQASIDRAAALAKLSPPPAAEPQAPAQAAVVSSPSSASRNSAQRSRPVERAPERSAPPVQERSAPARVARDVPQSGTRAYGAPIGEAPRQASIPLNAPINSPPTTPARRTDNAFVGRTLEASDASSMTRAPAAAPASNVGGTSDPSMSGSNAVAMPPAAAPDPAPSQAGAVAAVDVVPAKIVKRVAPVAPLGISRKTAGYVVVKFNITDSGRVADVEVVESTPRGLFDEAAQNAVRKWIYEPRKENGVAVVSQAKARLVFDADK